MRFYFAISSRGSVVCIFQFSLWDSHLLIVAFQFIYMFLSILFMRFSWRFKDYFKENSWLSILFMRFFWLFIRLPIFGKLLSILFMRFPDFTPFFSFNQKPAFNSLYEIRRITYLFLLYGLGPFNSLYEILWPKLEWGGTSQALSILFMRFISRLKNNHGSNYPLSILFMRF